MPPVADIAVETGGPVLGLGVSRSDHYRLSFVEGGELRSLAVGSYEGKMPDREMAQAWGEAWQSAGAASLVRWAAPFATVSHAGIAAALSVVQLFAERTVFDLMKLLTLVRDPTRRPWWERAIPDAVWAVVAEDMRWLRADQPTPGWRGDEVALAYTGYRAGLWSIPGSHWLAEPSADGDALFGVLQQHGWRHVLRQRPMD